MANDSGGSKANLIPVVLFVLLTTGVLIDPLTSSRPNDTGYLKPARTSHDKVEARLWQDPVVAVDKHVKKLEEEKANRGIREDTNKYNTIDHLKQNINDSVKIIAVSVQGQSYSEAIESRQRSRYAVISALGSREYITGDGESIQYFQLTDKDKKSLKIYSDRSANVKNQSKKQSDCTSDTSCKDDSKNDSVVWVNVPYEWFESNPGPGSEKPKKVLILWLNQDKITKSLYRDTIQYLFNKLGKEAAGFDLIGPSGTSFLVELLTRPPINTGISEDSIQTCDAKNVSLSKFRIISPSATISNQDLHSEINKEKYYDPCNLSGSSKSLDDFLHERSIIRTIGQDEDLAKALIWELQQRGIAPRKNSSKDSNQQDTNSDTNHLILISERDSLYVQKLTHHLRSYYKFVTGRSITEFSYLRGLDGKLPEDEPDKKTPDKEKKDSNNLLAQMDDASPEHAEGRNQFDYLRRLMDKIAQLDHNQNDRSKKVKAIGIIGNDVYDKLLILQALRDRFKDKIFFTTDLDARYLHADQIKWTRNLVVASNFDLALHPGLQGSTMPFRDGYQTSMYFATLSSMMQIDHRDWIKLWQWNNEKQIQHKDWIKLWRWNNRKQIQNWQKPQIFEIGKTEAVHLASPRLDYLDQWVSNRNEQLSHESGKNNNKKCSVNDLLACDTIEQDHTKKLDWKFLFFVIAAFGFICFVLYKTVPNAFSGFKSKNRTVSIGLIAFILLMSGLFAYAIYKDNYPTHQMGEPFLLMEGISVWPNLVIRFAAFLIMILIVYITFLWKQNKREEIERSYCIHKNSQQSAVRNWRDALWQGPHFKLENDNKETVSLLWNNYSYFTQLSQMLPWVIGLAVIGFILTYLGFLYLEPLNYPSRGVITHKLHEIFVMLQFGMLWGLVFWVGYEVIACKIFIDSLKSKSAWGNWPSDWRQSEAIKYGVSIESLIPYLRFQLITSAVKRIDWLIYIPFILMFLITIGRSNIFDNLGLPFIFIMVFLCALGYLTVTMSIFRKSAQKECDEILHYYEEDLADSDLVNNKEKIERLVDNIRRKHQETFLPLLRSPTSQAMLLPGGGIGLVQIVEYLFNR